MQQLLRQGKRCWGKRNLNFTTNNVCSIRNSIGSSIDHFRHSKLILFGSIVIFVRIRYSEVAIFNGSIFGVNTSTGAWIWRDLILQSVSRVQLCSGCNRYSEVVTCNGSIFSVRTSIGAWNSRSIGQRA